MDNCILQNLPNTHLRYLRKSPKWIQNSQNVYLFTCMGSDMTLQQPRPRKTFSTKWTLASLVMSPNVHRIGRHRNIGFLTMWAFSGFLVLQRPVKVNIIITLYWLYWLVFGVKIVIGCSSGMHILPIKFHLRKCMDYFI